MLLPPASRLLLLPPPNAYSLTRDALCLRPGRQACLCGARRQAKRGAKTTANHIALRGEPPGRTLVARRHLQMRFGLEVEPKILKEKIRDHNLPGSEFKRLDARIP